MSFHCCVFSKGCWKEWWRYGIPMRFYYRRHKWVTLIPGGLSYVFNRSMGDEIVPEPSRDPLGRERQ